jgi:hypothetical protein
MPEETKAKPEFNYNGPIDKTSIELAKIILGKLNDSKDFIFLPDFEKADPIAKAAFIEKSTDNSIEIMQEIAKSDIPYPYATRCIEKIINTLDVLKQYVQGTLEQNADEIMARTLQARDPENNRFVHQQSTVGNLLLKLNEAREATGNDKYDYFKRPEPVVTPVAPVEDTTATPLEAKEGGAVESPYQA